MRVLDLSHPIHAGMPVYPGTPRPGVAPANTIAEHGFAERLLTLSSHTGTHMDAPAHLLEGGRTLDSYPPDRFVGPGCVIDLAGLGLATSLLHDQEERLRGCALRSAPHRLEPLLGLSSLLSGVPDPDDRGGLVAGLPRPECGGSRRDLGRPGREHRPAGPPGPAGRRSAAHREPHQPGAPAAQRVHGVQPPAAAGRCRRRPLPRDRRARRHAQPVAISSWRGGGALDFRLSTFDRAGAGDQRLRTTSSMPSCE